MDALEKTPTQMPASWKSGDLAEAAHCFNLSEIENTANIIGEEAISIKLVCVGYGIRIELSIKESANDFSKDNLIGEGVYGHVYKGVLKDGQRITARLRKEESAQGFSKFHFEVYVLSFARHKNIVMLLGYCYKESKNSLIYEYICNKSLHRHLFENSETVLDWPQRYGIALGIAKVLRFLHGGPLIHKDMRPSNIFLTHDFVPMLADFGLASHKWNTGDDFHQTRIMETFGYLAPKYPKDEILNMKNSQEFKREFLWAEASLVKLKLVLINVGILQLFLDMVGANLMMLVGNSLTWDPGG